MPPQTLDELAQQHGALPPPGADALDALARQHGSGGATFHGTNEKDASGAAAVDPNTIGTFARHVGQQVNPVSIVKSAGQLLPLPKALGGAGVDAPLRFVQNSVFPTALLQKAQASYQEGDYVTAARHFVDYLLPIIGPALEKPADEMQQGKTAAGLGDTVGIGLAMFGPEALARANVKVPAVAKNQNPAEARAVQFGQQQGVPIDAATATGNKFVRGVQKLADESMGGSVVGERARTAQSDALTATGGRLADQSFPRSVTPEGAGQSISTALENKVRAHSGYADTAYDRLRTIEADPKNARPVSMTIPMTEAGTGKVIPTRTTVTVPLPVDLRGVKLALKPVYDRLNRQYPLLKQQASGGYKALENIVNGRDYAPLSEAEADLGAIKALARGAEMPELRSMSQGLAANAVKMLDTEVQKTAMTAGPDAVRALKDGRAATASKYQTADVLDRLKTEPVQAYRQMTAPKDAGIDLLRTVKREAPQTMPDIARAYLDDLLNTATAEGKFSHTDRLWAEWQKLGSETKQTLFPKKGHIEALNSFFLLAKKIGENPNPSGSGAIVMKGGEFGLWFHNPISGAAYSISLTAISKALHSPSFVNALTRGLRLTTGSQVSKAMQATGAAEVLRAAHEAQVPVVPAAAGPASER